MAADWTPDSIQTKRNERGLSQAQLAEALTEAGFPTSPRAVTAWETGASRVSARRAAGLTRVLGGAAEGFDAGAIVAGLTNEEMIAVAKELPDTVIITDIARRITRVPDSVPQRIGDRIWRTADAVQNVPEEDNREVESTGNDSP